MIDGTQIALLEWTTDLWASARHTNYFGWWQRPSPHACKNSKRKHLRCSAGSCSYYLLEGRSWPALFAEAARSLNLSSIAERPRRGARQEEFLAFFERSKSPMTLLRARFLLITIIDMVLHHDFVQFVAGDHCTSIFANMGWRPRRHLPTVTHLLLDFNDFSIVSIEFAAAFPRYTPFHADSTGSVSVNLRGSCSAGRQP